MSEPLVQFEVTLKVTGPTEQHVTDYCILHLRDRGFSVRRPSDTAAWETVKQFCARLDIHSQTLNRALARPDRPEVNIQYGTSGRRIIGIQRNDNFDAFVTRNKPATST